MGCGEPRGTHAVTVVAVFRIDTAANVGGLALAAFAGPTTREVVASERSESLRVSLKVRRTGSMPIPGE